MSGRPDPAAARWADDGGDAGGAGAGAEQGSADAPEVDVPVEDDPNAGAGGARILPDIAALTAERDDYLQSLQRLKADFDNYRKRVARLQQEQSARAAADLVAKLLPVLDNLDLAWAHLGHGQSEPSDGADSSGTPAGEAPSEEGRALAQARRQLLEILSKEGLERVDAVEVPFDPMVHDAVAHSAAEPESVESAAPGEVPEAPAAAAAPASAESPENGNGASPSAAKVEEVLRAGYRWRDQVLRPAMVRVRG